MKIKALLTTENVNSKKSSPLVSILGGSLLSISLLVGCQRFEPAPAPNEPPTVSLQEGATRGGGGYVGDLADQYLKEASQELAELLRNSSDAHFSDLPKDWTKEKLADVIENVRTNRTQEKVVHAPPQSNPNTNGTLKELMFDYGTDDKGPFIIALRPFFLALGLHDSIYEMPESKQKTLSEIKMRLLHEAAHHLGLNEVEAREYSINLLIKVTWDLAYCTIDRSSLVLKPQQFVSPDNETLIIQKSTGAYKFIQNPIDAELLVESYENESPRAPFIMTSESDEDPSKMQFIRADTITLKLSRNVLGANELAHGRLGFEFNDDYTITWDQGTKNSQPPTPTGNVKTSIFDNFTINQWNVIEFEKMTASGEYADLKLKCRNIQPMRKPTKN